MMKQLALLHRILTRPNIFATEEQRRIAKANLLCKQYLRDLKARKLFQLKLNLDGATKTIISNG